MENIQLFLQNNGNTEGGQYHSLFIAIDKYKYNIPSLECAVNDAKALMDVLQTKYTFSDRLKLLDNENADGFSITKELRGLKDIVKKTDSLLIFFAGHGHYDENDRKGYIVPFDCKPSFENGLSYNDILGHLTNIECENIALILDCCNAGQIFDAPIKTERIKSDSLFFFVASRKDESAHEGYKNSPFTENIIKLLKSNSQEKLLITELCSYVEKKFLDEQLRVLYPQRPKGHYANPSYQGDGFIFLNRDTEDSAWQKALEEHTLEAYNSFKFNYPNSNYPVNSNISLIESQTQEWKSFIVDSFEKLDQFISSFKDGQKNYLDEANELKHRIDEIHRRLNEKQSIEQDFSKLTSQSSIEELKFFVKTYENHPECEKYFLNIRGRINNLEKKSQAEKDWEDIKAKISRERTKPKFVRNLCISYHDEHYSYASARRMK